MAAPLMARRLSLGWALLMVAVVGALLPMVSPTAAAAAAELTRSESACGGYGGTARQADVEVPRTGVTPLPGRMWAPDAARQTGPCPVIVVLPGACSTFNTVEWAGPRLARLGYVVLAVNISAGNTTRCHEDAVAALDAATSAANPFLADTDTEQIGMAGWSLGGRTLVRTQEEDRRVDAIVVWDNLAMSESGDEGSPACTNQPNPIRTPRVPAMGQSSETCLDKEYGAKKVGYEHWKGNGQPTMQVTFAGSTHYWWGTSSTDHQQRVSIHYTAAWFDRFLKGDVQAEDRLLADQVEGRARRDVLSPLFVSAASLPGRAECVDLRNDCVPAAPPAPANTRVPAALGTAAAGSTLSATAGRWSGSPTSFTYRWFRCGASGDDCAPIASAASQSYVIGSDDRGSALRVEVTATSDHGSGHAMSTPTAAVLEPGARTLGTAAWAHRAGSSTQTGTQLVTDIFRGVDIDAAGNVVAVGTFGGSTTLSGTSATLTSAGVSDFMVAKYAPGGDAVWVKRFGGSFADNAYNVATDTSGNVYVVGTWVGQIVVGGTAHAAGANTRPFVMKLNSAGDPVWFRPLLASASAAGTTVVSEVAVDGAQNVYVSGSTLSGATTWSTSPVTAFPAPSTQSGFVARLSAAGVPQWVKSSTGTGITNFRTLGLASNGQVAVGGTFNDRVTLGSLPTLASRGGKDGFISHLDTSGTWTWAAQLGGPGDDEVRGVEPIGDDLVWGGMFSPGATALGESLPSVGGIDVLITRVGMNGQARWSKTIGATRDDEGAEVDVDPEGNIIVGGGFAGTLRFGGKTVRSGDVDMLAALLGPNGEERWVSDPLGSPPGSCINGLGCNDYIYDVATDAAGDYYFGGFFQDIGSFGATNIASAGREDAVIGRIPKTGVAPVAPPVIARTPDSRFAGLASFPFTPRYLHVDSTVGPLRMHYLDEGPADGPVVLLTHGLPGWSYLYRDVIPTLTGRGYRVIAPDLVGFGRSDKPTDEDLYTLDAHVEWLRSFVEQLNLSEASLVLHDSGGMIGLRLAATDAGDRFNRIVLLDTSIPDGTDPMSQSARDAFEYWRVVLRDAPAIHQYVDDMVQSGTARRLGADELAGYLAPFPGEDHTAGLRKNEFLYPVTTDAVGAADNTAARQALAAAWDKPVLIGFSAEGEALHPNARGVFQHIFADDLTDDLTFDTAKHFLQEDLGAALADVIIGFVDDTDGIAPTVRLAAPTHEAKYTQGQKVTAHYTCGDVGGSALASCTGPVPSGAQLPTGVLGEHLFTVRAADHAGNAAEVTHKYTVQAPTPAAAPCAAPTMKGKPCR